MYKCDGCGIAGRNSVMIRIEPISRSRGDVWVVRPFIYMCNECADKLSEMKWSNGLIFGGKNDNI